MYDNDQLLDQIAVRKKGLVVRRWHPEIPRHIYDDRVDAGLLVPLHDGVYRHAAVPFTQDMRWLAAVVAAGDDAVLSHRAAAALLGFPGIRFSRAEVTSPHTDLPLLDGVIVHRAVRLRPFERTTVREMPVTSKGKTSLDLCGVLPLHITSEIISEAVITKVVKPEELAATLERSTGRGIRGSQDLRAIGLTIDELKDLESVLEWRGWEELKPARIPAPVRQHELTCDDGRRVRFDLAWPDDRFGLDWDGKRWHATPARRRRTRERHESIVASGWGHLTYGWADVHESPADMRREVEDELAIRRHLAA